MMMEKIHNGEFIPINKDLDNFTSIQDQLPINEDSKNIIRTYLGDEKMMEKLSDNKRKTRGGKKNKNRKNKTQTKKNRRNKSKKSNRKK
jgi:hypothetical protein